MPVPVTKTFFAAVYNSLQALKSQTSQIEADPLSVKENSVGMTLRLVLEGNRQDAAVLTDWLKRHIVESRVDSTTVLL